MKRNRNSRFWPPPPRERWRFLQLQNRPFSSKYGILLLILTFLGITLTSPSNAASPDAIISGSQTRNISLLVEQAHSQGDNSSTLVVRAKRQFDHVSAAMCPTGCFPCSPMQCQTYQAQCVQQMPRVVNVMSCCCIPLIPAKPDLKTACDGEEAVAGCLNGLCGQGYECTKRRYCCRCKSGKSLGACVNGLCPSGYTCNSNDFCCPSVSGPVLGACINGLCPNGYDCGPDDMCHAKETGTTELGKPNVGEIAARELVRELLNYIRRHKDLEESLRRDNTYVRRGNYGGNRNTINKKRLLGLGKTKKKYSSLLSAESWLSSAQLEDDAGGGGGSVVAVAAPRQLSGVDAAAQFGAQQQQYYYPAGPPQFPAGSRNLTVN